MVFEKIKKIVLDEYEELKADAYEKPNEADPENIEAYLDTYTSEVLEKIRILLIGETTQKFGTPEVMKEMNSLNNDSDRKGREKQMPSNNDAMINKAKKLAAATINDLAHAKMGDGNPYFVKPSDMYIVWFCKTLQNWKAMVSTSKIKSDDPVGDYAEVTYDGDKGAAYCDLYKKQKNNCYIVEKEKMR